MSPTSTIRNGSARPSDEFFGDARPAATMVEVSGLATPEAAVEVEAVAEVE